MLGGGLLGGHVAVRLAERGHPVTVASRSFNPWLLERVHDGAAVELVERTIAATAELTDLIAAADVVFFLAGASTPTHADRHLTSSTVDSVVTALTVLDAMRQTDTRRVVLASSGGTIYGEPATLPTPESHPLDPIAIHGMNSVVTERYAEFFAQRHGFEVSLLRYSNVYGPGQTGRRGQGVVAAWCRAFSLGEPITVFGGLDVRRDFVYADDAAEATVEVALAPGATGAFNVGSGEAVPLRRVLELVGETADRPVSVRHEPSRGLDVAATALDCSRLTASTGWSAATPLTVGIRRSWDWVHGRLTGTGKMHAEATSRTD